MPLPRGAPFFDRESLLASSLGPNNRARNEWWRVCAYEYYDRDLEKQLTTYKFDPAFAGAVVSRTVSVKAAKPTKRKKRRRAKRTARR